MQAFEVKISPLVRKPVKEVENVNVLSLEPFKPHPKIFFENIIVGTLATKTLLIQNPYSRDICLYLTKIPPLERNVTLSWVEQVIPAEHEMNLEISWCPQKEGGWHDVLVLVDRKRIKKEISVTFKSINKRDNKKLGAIKKKISYSIKKKQPSLPNKRISKIQSPKKQSPKRQSLKKKSPKYRKMWAMPSTPNFLVPSENIRRETYCVKNKENQEPFYLSKRPHIVPEMFMGTNKRRSAWDNTSVFDDSLNTDTPLKEKTNFLIPPINILSPSSMINSSFDVKESNISSETYVKGNLSAGTYIITNEQDSFNTYVKDSSIGNLASLEESRIQSTSSPQTIDSVDTIVNANLWSNRDSPLKWQSFKHKSNKKITESNKILQHNVSTEINPMGNISSGTYTKGISFENITRLEESTFRKKKLPKFNKTCTTNATAKKINFSKHLSFNEIIKNQQLQFPDHDPNSFISNSEIVAHSLNIDPFMTATLFYDPKWVDEQEVRFIKWLNILLTPPDELNTNSDAPLLDVAKLWRQCKNREVDKAPTKEEMTKKFNSNALYNLRSNAKQFLNKPEIAQTISKVIHMIEADRLTIRKDRSVHLDLGLQQEIMGLLLCYNPIWLRIGFETIFGVTINLHNNTDITGIVDFAVNHFFKNSYLIKKYKSIRSEKYEVHIKKHILKKFFMFVYFVDKAKVNRLIPYDPCLFCKKSPIKESREVIQKFSSSIIHAGGDINRSLGFVGYSLEHKQEYIHEFEYAVESLGSDLRDGVRLTKVMEIILLQDNLTTRLRVPANSRLQKIYNMKVVFESLSTANFGIHHEIKPKDIVDGHKEKTLSFLWQLIDKFQSPRLTKAVTTVQNWWRSLQTVIKRRILLRKFKERESAANKIKVWFKHQIFIRKYRIFLSLFLEHRRNIAAIKIQSYVRMFLQRCRFKQTRDLKISQIIVIQSFTRGYLARKHFHKLKAAVNIIEEKYIARKQMLAQLKSYKDIKQAVIFIENKYHANKLMHYQRNEYLQLKSKTILIQRWYRAQRIRQNKFIYNVINIQRLFRAKLLMRKYLAEFTLLKQSAVVIQRNFRSYRIMKLEQNNFRQKKNAAIAIQTFFRQYLLMSKCRQKFIAQRNAVIIIQTRFRAYLLMKQTNLEFRMKKNAAIKIQNYFRSYLLMKQATNNFNEKKNAVMIIQNRFREYLAMKRARQQFIRKRNAITVIQQHLRAYLVMQQIRTEFVLKKNAAILIQKRFRDYLVMKRCRQQFIAQKNAVIIIQTRFKAHLLMKQTNLEFRMKKNAAIKIQNYFRSYLLMKQATNNFNEQKNAVMIIQNRFREYLAMKRARQQFIRKRNAITVIQQHLRAYLVMQQIRTEFVLKKNAVILIQKRFRDYLVMKRCRQQFIAQKNAVIIIQTRFKAHLLMKQTNLEFRMKKNAAIKIQNYFRSYLLMKQDTNNFNEKKNAVMIIQNRFREYLAMKRARQQFIRKRNAISVIQQHLRAYLVMQQIKTEFVLKKNAAILIQKRFRDYLVMKKCRQEFISQKNAVMIIQRRFRDYLVMKKCREELIAQKNAVMIVQTRFRAYLLKKQTNIEFKMKKNSAIKIQNYFRSYLLKKEAINNFNERRNAIMIIQNRFREYLAMKRARQQFTSQRNAIIVIQQHFKAYLVMKRMRTEFVLKKNAAILIQRRFRDYLVMKKRRDEFIAQKNAVISIQRFYRNYTERKLEENKKIEVLVIKIQAYARGYRARLDYKVLCNNFEEVQKRREASRKEQCATKIQALWRGFKARRSSSKRVSDIRKRCQNAQKNVNPENTIAFLNNEAMDILRGRGYVDLSEYLGAIKHLNYTVRRFKKELMNFAEPFSGTIMHFILSPGRSLIDMQAKKFATSIMISIMKYQPAAKFAWFPNCTTNLIKQMVIFCDKENDLFPYLCTLFWLYCNNEEYLNHIKSITVLRTQMDKIKMLCDRKQKMVLNASFKGNKSVFAYYSTLPLPWVLPDWGLDLKDKPRTFTNSVHAYKAVFDILDFIPL